MNTLFIVTYGDIHLYFLNENKAYEKVISYINDELNEYLHIFDDINKQSNHSKDCISHFKNMKNPKEAYQYYKSNLDNIYYYFYDGGNESWIMFQYSNIFIEELDIRD